MRKILYISGTRADYGPARKLLLGLNSDPSIDLQILVTGMHLDPIHGETWKEIEADGFKIASKVEGRVEGDSLSVMGSSVGNYLAGMSKALSHLTPDIVLVLGDRGEALAGAMAAAFQNIVVAHLCGGSLSGSIDDSIRHAITKFAHIHLPAFPNHKKRILQLGEKEENVHAVGLPGADLSGDVSYKSSEIYEKFSIKEGSPYILVVQHPVTSSSDEVEAQITETLEACAESGYPILLANPNDDAGGRKILSLMKKYAESYENIQILPPLSSRELFASTMAHAAVMIGNSSSGVVESLSIDLPVINVGDRQRGRESMGYMINVDYDRNEIKEAIKKALFDDKFKTELKSFAEKNYKKNTALEVKQILKSLDLEKAIRPKNFVDLEFRGK